MSKEDIFIIVGDEIEKWELDKSSPAYGFYQMYEPSEDHPGYETVRTFPIWLYDMEGDTKRQDNYIGVGSHTIWFKELEAAEKFLKEKR